MYLFFDTETTGVPLNYKAPASEVDNWPRLVQLAYVIYNEQGELLYDINDIIKPDNFIIPKDSSDIHGITTEKAINEGKGLKNVLNKFLLHVKRADYLVAHNMEFDTKIVESEMIRTNFLNVIKEKKKICTMLASTDFCELPGKKGYKWPKLSELHIRLFGINFDHSHNAFEDVQATSKCFWELKKRGIINIPNITNNLIDNTLPISKSDYCNQTIKDTIDIIEKESEIFLTSSVIDICKQKVESDSSLDFNELILLMYTKYKYTVPIYIRFLPAILINVLNNKGFGKYFRSKYFSIDTLFDLKYELESKTLTDLREMMKKLQSEAESSIERSILNLDNLVYFLNTNFPDRSIENISPTNDLKSTKSLLKDLKEFNISFKEIDEGYKRINDYIQLIENEEYRYDSKMKKSTQIGMVRIILYINDYKYLAAKKLPIDITLFYQHWNYIIDSGQKAKDIAESEIPAWTYFDFDFDLLGPL